MLNWVKAHPIWSGLIGVLVLFLLWRMLSGGSSTASTGAIQTVQQDPSVVAAGYQLQALQYQQQTAQQSIAAAAEVEADKNATQIMLAQIAATAQGSQTQLMAQIEASRLASEERQGTLQSTLAAQLEASRIQASQQQATLFAGIEQSRIASEAHTTELLATTQSQTAIAIQASQAELTKAITAGQTEIQKQLIQSNQAVAQAQIKASKPKLCFITTAACELQGKPDNCDELTTLRAFRDGWLLSRPCGAQMIAEYYRIAPLMLEALRVRPDGDVILMEVYGDYIVPAVDLIKAGRNEDAFRMYVQMLRFVSENYVPSLVVSIDAGDVPSSGAVVDASLCPVNRAA